MKKTILCIDDIETNLFTLQSVIESLNGDSYNVLIASSANEGLAILLRQKIDIILLDIMMPEIDGYEACKMIKSNKKTKDIPVIFVTAKRDDKTIEECFKVGGDDYINKPFNHAELFSRLAFHLKLKEKSEQLKKEKEYTQNILDLQNNMILVTDGTKALSVNKALLDFFSLKNLKEFQKRYGCINSAFVKDDGYFPFNESYESLWIDEVIKLSSKEDILIKINKNNNEYIFNIKATIFHTQYIITLTDITQVSQLSLEYKYEANYDALTKIYNRNMFHRLIDRKITIARTEQKYFVFIILDIDFFKKVNDVYGHLAGDEILKDVVKLIKNHTRDSDIFARWGGEEFVLTFDVSIEKGIEIANSLRKHIKKKKFNIPKNITCSFGITEFKMDDTLKEMILRADEALYKAKETGRNKVCQI